MLTLTRSSKPLSFRPQPSHERSEWDGVVEDLLFVSSPTTHVGTAAFGCSAKRSEPVRNGHFLSGAFDVDLDPLLQPFVIPTAAVP